MLADREKSITDGQTVPADLTFVEGRYYKSAIQNEYGIGHSGWGGQIIWADPESGIIIAGNSQLKSELPAPMTTSENSMKQHMISLNTIGIKKSN